MAVHDNNIICRTQDSNTHDRTKDKIMEDRLFGMVAINIVSNILISNLLLYEDTMQCEFSVVFNQLSSSIIESGNFCVLINF